MVSGFASTGIHPFNLDAIPEDAYLPSLACQGAAGEHPEELLTNEPEQPVQPDPAHAEEIPANVVQVVTDVHTPADENPANILQLPILNVDGDEEIMTLPVDFNILPVDPEPGLDNVALMEVQNDRGHITK